MADAPKYHLSPSILDKYTEYISSEISWGKFYGNSEEPSFTIEEWTAKMESELIDAVNGVITPSSRAAELGTCLNEAVDCILLGVPSTRKDVTLQSGQAGHDGKNDLGDCIFALTDDNKFLFHKEDVVNLTTHVAGMIPQDLVSARIDISCGKVELYGYPDYYDPNSGIVIDLKTTRGYECGKYRYKWQRYIYPYILTESGKMSKYNEFRFLVCKVTGDGRRNPFVELEMFNETYTDPLIGMRDKIAIACENFIAWYDDQRNKGVCNDRLIGGRKK